MSVATCTQSGITSKRLKQGALTKAISEKQALKQFGTMMNKLIANAPKTASEAVSAIVEQFRTVRVKCERDTLRFEWGTDRPLSMTVFADLRATDDGDLVMTTGFAHQCFRQSTTQQSATSDRSLRWRRQLTIAQHTQFE